MRFAVGISILFGLSFLSCSNSSDNNSTLNTRYIGENHLSATIDRNMIFIVSSEHDDHEAYLWLNQHPVTLQKTVQINSTHRAWVATPSSINENDVLRIEKNTNNQKRVLTLKVQKENGVIILQKISEEEAPQASEPIPPSAQPQYPKIAGNQVEIADFLDVFNAYRAQHGLRPVRYSARLTQDAAVNNQYQLRSGLGHFYMGATHAQNSAMGYGSIAHVMQGWHYSSGHRANMLGANWTCMGIHRLGNYWTQNFSAWKDCI